MKILALAGPFSATGFAAASLATLAFDRLSLSHPLESGLVSWFCVMERRLWSTMPPVPSFYPILSASTFESHERGPNIQKTKSYC